MKKFARTFSPSKFIYPSPQKSSPAAKELPPPPPPPPLKFDIIIAQVYGPTANIYKDIFQVAPTASQHELKEAYLRTRNETQAKLAKLSNNNNRKSILKSKERNKAKQKKHLVMQMNAISEAYQIVIDEQKKKEYDASIGEKEQVSEVSFDGNAGEFPGDEQQNKAIEVVTPAPDLKSRMKEYIKDKTTTDDRVEEVTSTTHHVDLNSRMKEYLESKQEVTSAHHVDSNSRMKEYEDDYDVITTKEDPNEKVFTLESLGAPSPPTSPEDAKKNLPMVSPTGVLDFHKSLSDQPGVTKNEGPDDMISPIARVRQDKEQLADVFASYQNLKNFINGTECKDDEKTNHDDSDSVGEGDFSSDGTVKVSHCQGALGIADFAEEVMTQASNLADGFCYSGNACLIY
ncbi:hypothetical protein QTG54_003487 [Skeletonema marinoi]|uniref:J domain-containing protein n=1 Tax=Skeletonema marinoi TaxID=267567 RepID=A0AAD8YGL5_9STRA|nr:hypothetical protein QTG54_003487 [Skeletonema marinoi]